MIVAQTRTQLADGLRALRERGDPLSLVPTMGSLHRGHLSLVDRARERGGPVVLSIFVNPTQFGPEEDFEAYPRALGDDLTKAGAAGVDLVFAPKDDHVIYPDGAPAVTVDPGPMSERLCGAFRPGHFRGVLTVVAKLFGLIRPDLAVFGRKDFQQGVLIRRMIQDLELAVEVELAPIVREEDGLALSSRNAYLSPEERDQAVGLHRALAAALELFREGEREAGTLLEAIRMVAGSHPGVTLQYAEIVDADDLRFVGEAREGSVAAVAGFCGDTRLIDNVVLRGG